jgi:anti-sigma B factor antagonist
MALDAPLLIERRDGKNPGTRILQLTGPLTLGNLFDFQDELRKGEPPRVAILDLSGVPYMDSSGMGAVINYHVHCERNGGRLIVAGVSSRVLELFKLTHVDTVIAMAANVEAAEG